MSENQRCAERLESIPYSSDHLFQADHHQLPCGACVKCGERYDDYNSRVLVLLHSKGIGVGPVIYTPVVTPKTPSAQETLAAIGVQSQEIALLRSQLAESQAQDADSALDKAELSRIRPHRGEPYFHSTIGEWADQCNLNTQNRLRIEKLEGELAARTEERDGYRADLDSIAVAVYPGKEPRSTYSVAFLADEITRRTAERDAALSGVTALQRHLDGLQKLVLAHENAEASVCPEDVGIVEYVKALRKEWDGLAAALESAISDAHAIARHIQNGSSPWDRIGLLVTSYSIDKLVALLAARDARAKAEGLREAATYIASEFPLNDVAYHALRRMAEGDAPSVAPHG